MRRIVKRTVTVTSIETWTISIESQMPIEPLRAEETPAILDGIATGGDDLPTKQPIECEAEDVKSTGVVHPTIEAKQD